MGYPIFDGNNYNNTVSICFIFTDPALAVNEADLIKVVIKNKGDDIVLTPDSFNGMPSYDFQSSSSVYAMVSNKASVPTNNHLIYRSCGVVLLLTVVHQIPYRSELDNPRCHYAVIK